MQERDKLRHEVEEMRTKVKNMEQQNNALRHENFELRGKGSSDLMGDFPTNEEILKSYVDFNEQVLV